MFTGSEQHTHLVESLLAVNIRSMRLADWFVEIELSKASKLADLTNTIARNKAMLQFASDRYCNQNTRQQTTTNELNTPEVGQATDSTSAYIWKCPVITCAEEHCTRTFAARKALLSHMRAEHQIRSVLHSAIVINICPFCSSCFRTPAHALTHARRAIPRGFCRTNMSRVPYTPNERPKQCPLCKFHCESADSYDQHLRSHFAKSASAVQS